MSVNRCSVAVVALGVFFCVAESKPLSSSGCACSSGCGKSLAVRSSDFSTYEWCSVDLDCKAVGWDWCHDTAGLYNLVVSQKHIAEEKQHQEEHMRLAEHTKRELAERAGAEVRAQLVTAQIKLKDAELEFAKLTKQLSVEQKNQANTETKLSDKLKQVSAALYHDKASQVKETSALKQKLTQAKSDAEKIQAVVDAMRVEANQKLKASEDRVAKAKDLLKRSQLELGEMEKGRKSAEATARDFETKFEDSTKAMAKLKAEDAKRLAEANHKQAETQETLEQVELEEDSVSAKLKELQEKQDGLEKQASDAKNKKHVAETAAKDAEGRRDAAELRTFRLSIRGAVRGGTGVVKKDGTVDRWRIR